MERNRHGQGMSGVPGKPPHHQPIGTGLRNPQTYAVHEIIGQRCSRSKTGTEDVPDRRRRRQPGERDFAVRQERLYRHANHGGVLRGKVSQGTEAPVQRGRAKADVVETLHEATSPGGAACCGTLAEV